MFASTCECLNFGNCVGNSGSDDACKGGSKNDCDDGSNSGGDSDSEDESGVAEIVIGAIVVVVASVISVVFDKTGFFDSAIISPGAFAFASASASLPHCFSQTPCLWLL